MKIIISKIKDGAQLSIDLEPYCQSINLKHPEHNSKFQKEQQIIREYFVGFTASMIFDELLNTALQDSSAADKEKICNSPAIQALQNNRFIELLKNSADAMIDRYLLSGAEIKEAKLELNFIIKMEEKQIKVTINDNSGGFLQEFLDRYNSDSIRQGKYLKAVSSPKKFFHFGGAGRGIPFLLTYVMKGAVKVGANRIKQQEIVPEDDPSIVEFKNSNNGAIIEIKTPLKAREVYPQASAAEENEEESEEENEAENEDVPMLSPINLAEIKKRTFLLSLKNKCQKMEFFHSENEQDSPPISSPPSPDSHSCVRLF